VADNEITWQETAEWLEANRKNSAWLAKTLGVSASTPSRWSKGDPIPEPSQHLLRLLIRGELPPGFAAPRDPAVLAFTQEEWRVIELCSVREGYPDATSWVVAKIRAYLAMSNQAPALALVPDLDPRYSGKVAEEPKR